MSMDITFLGTGSAYPSPHRGASALVLRTDGDCWLFDCGEGTQTQLMKSQLRAGRITKVFISHLHGDHLFGLPGLLCTVSLNTNADPQQSPACVDIYGPVGLRKFLRVTLGLTGSQLLFPYAVHELEPTLDQSPEEGQLSMEEHDRPGRLKTELLKELGLKPGPLYGRLKAGESIILESGRLVHPSEVLEETIPGRKVCVFGDCSSVLGDGPLRLCSGADVLVHEATLGNEHREKAVDHGHSTPEMAAAVARACCARKLVLHHFSQRYKPSSSQKDGDDDNVLELKRQAEDVLQDSSVEVILAEDFMNLPILLRR
uniref:ElaC homolog 1 n=1 Tax=Nothobranchius rachovii TaxID=451742 RepID=A0A1A8PW36_9TELE